MEMSQENSLHSYLKQTKISLFFSFTKSEDRRVEEVLSGGVVVVPVRGGRSGKRV
jgi:hypothetical protein